MLPPTSDSKQLELEHRSLVRVGLIATGIVGVSVVRHFNIYEVSGYLYLLAGALLFAVLGSSWRGATRAGAILLLDLPADYSASTRSRWLWPLAGLVFMCGALIFLEARQPYYFTQDDNLAQFLPGMLQGCRSLAAGVFPSWNPYQFLG